MEILLTAYTAHSLSLPRYENTNLFALLLYAAIIASSAYEATPTNIRIKTRKFSLLYVVCLAFFVYSYFEHILIIMAIWRKNWKQKLKLNSMFNKMENECISMSMCDSCAIQFWHGIEMKRKLNLYRLRVLWSRVAVEHENMCFGFDSKMRFVYCCARSFWCFRLTPTSSLYLYVSLIVLQREYDIGRKSTHKKEIDIFFLTICSRYTSFVWAFHFLSTLLSGVRVATIDAKFKGRATECIHSTHTQTDTETHV